MAMRSPCAGSTAFASSISLARGGIGIGEGARLDEFHAARVRCFVRRTHRSERGHPTEAALIIPDAFGAFALVEPDRLAAPWVKKFEDEAGKGGADSTTSMCFFGLRLLRQFVFYVVHPLIH
jgi:hypothetical protein